MPISTKIIDARSISDRGRSAERIPIGIERDSQKKAPPNTSDAVTGASCPMMKLTLWRLTYDVPSDSWPTRFQRKIQYCC